jgi:hypothetical protein
LKDPDFIEPDQVSIPISPVLAHYLRNSMANKRVSHRRARPRSAGPFFHIGVWPSREIVRFRLRGVGNPAASGGSLANVRGFMGHTKMADRKGRRPYIQNGRLLPHIIASSRPVMCAVILGGRNIPEADKPTLAMSRQLKNNKMTQAAVRRRKGTRSRNAKAWSYRSNPW